MDQIEYISPKDLEELFGAIKETKGQAKFIAGCTNMIPKMRAGTISPELLVDLSGLQELGHIRENHGAMSIGALTTISEVAGSEIIRNHSPILSSAASSLGNPLTRNRATIGGNLADASPAADMAPPLLAMEAAIHAERPKGKKRVIPIEQFFLGPHKTILEDDEIIIQITFPKPRDSANGSYMKLGLRDSMAISVASVTVILEMEGKLCQKARVALGAVAPTPIRAYRVEEKLEGRELDQAIIEECSAVVKEEISPIDDIRASAEYRRLVTSVLLKRGINEALKGEDT
jgi:carbon-monoxide dehydrogenase medium subunit